MIVNVLLILGGLFLVVTYVDSQDAYTFSDLVDAATSDLKHERIEQTYKNVLENTKMPEALK